MTATMTTFYYKRRYEITDDQASVLVALERKYQSVRFLGRIHGTPDIRVGLSAAPEQSRYITIDHLGGIREGWRL